MEGIHSQTCLAIYIYIYKKFFNKKGEKKRRSPFTSPPPMDKA